jgi:hypothetical protein
MTKLIGAQDRTWAHAGIRKGYHWVINRSVPHAFFCTRDALKLDYVPYVPRPKEQRLCNHMGKAKLNTQPRQNQFARSKASLVVLQCLFTRTDAARGIRSLAQNCHHPRVHRRLKVSHTNNSSNHKGDAGGLENVRECGIYDEALLQRLGRGDCSLLARGSAHPGQGLVSGMGATPI